MIITFIILPRVKELFLDDEPVDELCDDENSEESPLPLELLLELEDELCLLFLSHILSFHLLIYLFTRLCIFFFHNNVLFVSITSLLSNFVYFSHFQNFLNLPPHHNSLN
jgi:hypothetical protein